MRIPGFDRRDRRPDPPPTEPVYVERRPGESAEAFEARLSDAAHYRRPRSDYDSHEAYVEGRRDQRVADRHEDIPAERRAYAEGRRDQDRVERHDRVVRRRGGLGLFGVAVALVAILGVLWVVLAVREGSFGAGGAVVDQKIAEVSQPVRMAANQAVERTGQAVQNAGQALDRQGERLRDSAE